MPRCGLVRDGDQLGVDDHDEREGVLRQGRAERCKAERRHPLQQVQDLSFLGLFVFIFLPFGNKFTEKL